MEAIALGLALFVIVAVIPFLFRHSLAEWIAAGGIFGRPGPLEEGERRVKWLILIAGPQAALLIVIGIVREVS